ncbi:stealth conserved region 3 domain-containing protein [Demequina sp. NBRC 110051]|uniref:stealth conserved region 3 domain-containing protein n=1 Tax=Demequina sp. NBRC 110051 TaxID=1570340 RepID=UPI00135668F8|nr:stealth conserved region 3 domain-containing protein [Demequina sp. NBRC 110051]
MLSARHTVRLEAMEAPASPVGSTDEDLVVLTDARQIAPASGRADGLAPHVLYLAAPLSRTDAVLLGERARDVAGVVVAQPVPLGPVVAAVAGTTPVLLSEPWPAPAPYTPRSPLAVPLVAALIPETSEAEAASVVDAFLLASRSAPDWRLRVYGSAQACREVLTRARRVGLGGRVDAVAPPPSPSRELSKASVVLLVGSVGASREHLVQAIHTGVSVVGDEGVPDLLSVARAGGALATAPNAKARGAALRYAMDSKSVRFGLVKRAEEVLESVVVDQPAALWETVVTSAGNGARPRLREAAPDAAGSADFRSLVVQGLRDRGVHSAQVRGEAGDLAIVVGIEDAIDVFSLVTGLLEQGRCSASPRVGSAPLQSTPALSTDQLVPFSLHANVWTLRAQSGATIDIELWEVEDRLRRAPRRNLETDVVAEDQWRAWLTRESSSVTGLPLWSDITFPIDAVYTWVDGSDEAWLKRKNAFDSSTAQDAAEGAEPGRYLSRDELYYSIATVRRAMPWVRQIFVVTDGQIHPRVRDEFPEVRWVDHQEIFPDPSVLPVFNSHAIEACLHRIADLSEHFIMFNDDVFVMKPLGPERFFEPNGQARFFPSKFQLGFHDSHTGEAHLLAGAHNRRLLAERFGVEITNTMLHTPHPHLRSVLGQLEDAYAEEFERTRSSRFRSGGDLSVLSSLAQYYGWATHSYVRSSVEFRFLRLHHVRLEHRMKEILDDARVEVMCLGEPLAHQHAHAHDPAIVRQFLTDVVHRLA